MTLNLKLDLLFTNLNLGHNFLTGSDRDFICVFLVARHFTWFMTSLPWPWSLTYFSKTVTLAITFLQEVMGLSYFTCVFLVTRLYTWYCNIWPYDLDLEVWPTFEKLKLCCHLVMFAARRASLSSDNSYLKACCPQVISTDLVINTRSFLLRQVEVLAARCWNLQSWRHKAIWLEPSTAELGTHNVWTATLARTSIACSRLQC